MPTEERTRLTTYETLCFAY